MLQHLAVFQQLLPLLRLDGYYVISDLTGVPDILTRIRPILRSLLPWREADESVTALKPWVRLVVSAYVPMLVPILVLIMTMLIFPAPRVMATAWDCLGIQLERMRGASAAVVVAGGLQTLALVLPAAGTTVSLSRLGKRIVTGLGRWAHGAPPRMAVVGGGSRTRRRACGLHPVAERRLPADRPRRQGHGPQRSAQHQGAPRAGSPRSSQSRRARARSPLPPASRNPRDPRRGRGGPPKPSNGRSEAPDRRRASRTSPGGAGLPPVSRSRRGFGARG